MQYNFCPLCAQGLGFNKRFGKQACTCGFVHWESPTPVAVTLVHYDSANLHDTGRSDYIGSDEVGILLVQRKYNPGKGDWALPGGFIDSYEEPEAAAIREVNEETGIDIVIDALLKAQKVPTPGVNNLILFYAAHPIGGKLMAGDDAAAAQVYGISCLPSICFSTHRDIVQEWLTTHGF